VIAFNQLIFDSPIRDSRSYKNSSVGAPQEKK
jgi:hypothetical protein